MSNALTPDHFSPHLDKSFRVDSGNLSLTLTRIERRKREEWELELPFREPFNLIFRGPPGDILQPGMHNLATEDGAAFELYVIPVHTPMRDRQDYQASFN